MKDAWLCNLQGGPDPQVEKHRSKFSTRSHQRGEKHGRSSVRTGVTPLHLVALLETSNHWAECFPHSKFLRSVYVRLTHLFSWQPYEVDMIAVMNASEKSNDVLRLIRILLRKQNEKTSGLMLASMLSSLSLLLFHYRDCTIHALDPLPQSHGWLV